MPNQEFQLTQTRPGVFAHKGSALVMVGHWALSFDVTPPSGPSFVATLVDHATG
jgi:hypothetical protein